MVNEKESSTGGLEWRVKVADGSSETLVPEPAGLIRRAGLGLQSLVTGFVMKVWRFLVKAWELAVDDPRRVIHGSKVGLALTLVSMFYYLRPLYQGFGGNAIWAVMTVVVVFDYTVGQTLSKCVNRALGTSLAASLAVGIHWVASKSGKEFEPVILGASVFLLGMAATFSRFIPTIKARFDYGVMIFILTFSLVAVSGYRVEKLLELALQRVTTIAIGISMCILLSMLVCPVWAGQDLHALITRNMDKLANSLDGSVAEYFTDSENETENEKDCHNKSINGYKCVLNSKASEEALAIFARWEPAHGRFGFRHPWKQYLKIGAMMRNCAYCIEALYGCINSEIHADEFTKKHLSDVCMKLSSHSAKVLTELAMITKTMRRSSILDFSVGEMNIAVGDLQNVLKSLPTQLFNDNSTTTTTTTTTTTSKPDQDNDHQEAKEPTITATKTVPLLEILPVVSIASLLIEITTRIEGIVDAVDELAGLAGFNPADEKKPKQTQLINNKPADTEHSIENEQEQDITMKTLQMV